jgi:hypothetical protein
MVATSAPQAPRTIERRTLTVEEAIALIGCGRTSGYDEIRRTGALCGVRVVRVGTRVFIPRAALERALDGAPQPPSDDAPCAA